MFDAILVTKEAVREAVRVKQVAPSKNLSLEIQKLSSVMLEMAEITPPAALEIMEREAVAGQRKKWSLLWEIELSMELIPEETMAPLPEEAMAPMEEVVNLKIQEAVELVPEEAKSRVQGEAMDPAPEEIMELVVLVAKGPGTQEDTERVILEMVLVISKYSSFSDKET